MNGNQPKGSERRFLLEMSSDSFWGCVHVLSSQERRAVENLRRQGFRAFYPFFIERKHVGLPRSQPLFPGYVFIFLEPGLPWGAIRSTRGVIRLLTSGEGVPERLDPIFAESLKRCLVPDPDLAQSGMIHIGTRVRVRRGPFEGSSAIVLWSRADRLRLFFSVFNREVIAEFNSVDVEVAGS